MSIRDGISVLWSWMRAKKLLNNLERMSCNALGSSQSAKRAKVYSDVDLIRSNGSYELSSTTKLTLKTIIATAREIIRSSKWNSLINIFIIISSKLVISFGAQHTFTPSETICNGIKYSVIGSSVENALRGEFEDFKELPSDEKERTHTHAHIYMHETAANNSLLRIERVREAGSHRHCFDTCHESMKPL